MKQIASELRRMAGNDPTLPNDRPDPEREWVFPGTGKSGGKDFRVVGIETRDGEPWTKYTILSGYGLSAQVEVWHCYPKDQWTREQAAAHAGYA